MNKVAPIYTSWNTGPDANNNNFILSRDIRNKDYLDFRFGSTKSYEYINERFGFGSGRRNNGVGSLGGSNFGGKRTRADDNDGDVTISYSKKERVRHFYSFTSPNNDNRKYKLFNMFPFTKKWVSTHKNPDSTFVFPLYNNSFYFYFGLNRGNTAIDKFYRDFYDDCVEDVND